MARSACRTASSSPAALYGWTMVVTGTGADDSGSASSGPTASRIACVIPNVRYRRDIGDRLMAGDFERVEALGFLDAL